MSTSSPTPTPPLCDVRKILALRGPNIWSRATLLECWLAIPPLPAAAPNWKSALLECMPELDPLLSEALHPETDGAATATLLQHLTQELQNRVTMRSPFGQVVRSCKEPHLYRLLVQFEEEGVARAAFDLALRFTEAVLTGQEFPFAAEMEKLSDLSHEICLGPSTGAMVTAALARGIPIRRLTEGSLVQLGYGSKQRKILAAATSQTSAIAEDIVQDKDLTRRLLKEVGLPVPEGRPVTTAEDAWKAAQEIGVPVVVKPRDGNQGRGVALNLFTREQVASAFDLALQESDSVIVEQFAPGQDFRVLVIGREMVAASRRQPAHVIGDGTHSIEELIQEVNRDPRRASDHAAALSKIKIDGIALQVLAEQNMTPESIPDRGQMILIRRNANLSTGGTAVDVTDQVHPTIRDAVIEAAQAVNLDICGIDLVAEDISQPLSRHNGVIIELNARPGLRMHLYPSEGEPRPVGKTVIDMMFPPGETGRIPIVAVTGVNGKTTTTRFIAHLLSQTGQCVGMTSTDGIFIGRRLLDTGDCSGPKSARTVLSNPMVDAAVLETARGGILREGLAFDHCDVAVVTNIGEGDHLGLSEIDTIEKLAEVKSCVVAAVPAHGHAVLNAMDPLVVAMAERYPRQIIYFATDAAHPVIQQHRNEGGKVLFSREGQIVLAQGNYEAPLMALSEVPITREGRIGFQVENTLAAIGAGWALGLSDAHLLAGARSFAPNLDLNAGRFNILEIRGITIVVDYGHNVSAIRSLLNALAGFPHTHRIAVFSAPGDRRDEDILEQGRLIGPAFDEVWLYEGDYCRGRRPGEIMDLLAQGMGTSTRARRIEKVHGALAALDQAIAMARSGSLLLVQADTADETVQHLKKVYQV